MAGMNHSLQDYILDQRAALVELLKRPLVELSVELSTVWGDRGSLDGMLLRSLPSIPHCKFLYVMDAKGIQTSSNIGDEGLIEVDYGRDRLQRPYMRGLNDDERFTLSEAYISLRERRPSVTAVTRVERGGVLLGYLGADFGLKDLPLDIELYEEPQVWRQLKGDPAIRRNLFGQSREESALDRRMDTVMAVMEELYVDRGLFHGKIHFASSRATIWLYSDPYRYRILDIEALIDPDICMAFPRREYSAPATVTVGQVRQVLARFRDLRNLDEILYLRSGTLNVVNGMVGLTFSCDGSHYMTVGDFLDKPMSFWGGKDVDERAPEPGVPEADR